MHIRGAHIDFVPVNRDGALVAGVHPGGQQPHILPEQVAGGGIERFEFVSRTVQEHHSVMNQGRGFIGAGGKRPCPRDAQIVHIRFRNLLQRAESVIVETAAPREPVARGRILQQRVGVGSVFIVRVRLLRRRRQLHAGR